MAIESLNQISESKYGRDSDKSWTSDFKRYITKIEFLSVKETKDQVITRYDNKAKVCAIALNSMHMYYCQVYFYNPETNVGYPVKLFNLVKPNDHPAFSSSGKTSLWIDDLQYTPNSLTLILLFRAKSIAILTRLGSLLKFIIHPAYDLPKEISLSKGSSQQRRFHDLLYNREGLTVDRTYDREILALMVEKDRFLVKDNRVIFIFAYTEIWDPI